MNDNPEFGKNYWIALGLSLLVLLFYPFFLKWVNPPQPAGTHQAALESPAPAPESALPEEGAAPHNTLTEPDGPFLEMPEKPTIIPFENNVFKAEFSTMGGTIASLFYKGEGGHEDLTKTLLYQNDEAGSGFLGVRLLHDAADLSRTVFKLVRQGPQDDIFEFQYERAGEFRMTKTIRPSDKDPAIYMEIALENKSNRPKHFPMELIYGMDYSGAEGADVRYTEAVVQTDKLKTANEGKVRKKGFAVNEPAKWAGIIKKYFAVLVKPDWNIVGNNYEEPSKGLIRGAMQMEPISLAPGEILQRNVLIYAGPQRYETLKDFGLGFEEVFSRGFFGLFKVWILFALKFFYKFTHNYGWSIILLTLIIKGLFTPLTHASFENMKKMQVVQPKMKNLQERYKNDPARLNKEMMELYKRNKVNPMMGCLPMLLQIPIFISFYHALAEAIELKGAPFIFWIQDLSAPDKLFTLPFDLPFLGDGINLLPILMIGSMVWQQRLTPTASASPEQAKMMTFMPLIFGVLFYGMPSGLVLYWFVNNVLSIIHQVFVKRIVIELHHEDRD